jgi:hypothetical protein
MNEPTAIDTTASRTRNGGLTFTATYHCGEHTVQVSVERDFYVRQSLATASVLTPGMTWTVLCHEPPDTWHSTARDQVDLIALANGLLVRACRILRLPTA